MTCFLELQNHTTNIHTLEDYLSKNFAKIYDCFELQKHSDLLTSKEEIRIYVALNWLVLNQLNKTKPTNLSFLALLLDVCERLGLRSQFKLLYDFLSISDFNIGSRLKASSLYLLNVTVVDDYLNRYEEINSLLQTSYETEEDNQDKVLSTAINYYAQVLIDFGQFNPVSVEQLKAKFEATISANSFSFLKHGLIESVLGIETAEYEKAYNQIHFLLDSFLGRDIVKPQYNPNFLIEIETDYAKAIENTQLNFNAIRQISVDRYAFIKNDSIFHSLQRGVKVLTEESQLFAYMYSFGNMHYQKLITSFDYLPKNTLNNKINIVDWACGQAMATMTFLDYLNNKNIQHDINKITLIEPSEIALKRGALHIKKYVAKDNIETINKDLDSLTDTDFQNDNNTHLHLFSNILDIDLFSLTALIQRLENNFKGINYFVCVSPYINDIKTNRLDTFMKSFSDKDDFHKFISIDNKTGEWTNNGWTRVFRVFKCRI